MAEVLAKAEKYINDEEALLSKRENSSAQKEKRRGEKKQERSPMRRGDRDRSPRRDKEEQRTTSKETRQCQGPLGPTSSRAVAAISTPAIHPLDSLGVTGLTLDAAQKVFKVTISDEGRPSKKRLNQVL